MFIDYWIINKYSIKLIRFIQNENFEKISQLNSTKNLLDEIEIVISKYLKSILDKELKSKPFLDLVAKQKKHSIQSKKIRWHPHLSKI